MATAAAVLMLSSFFAGPVVAAGTPPEGGSIAAESKPVGLPADISISEAAKMRTEGAFILDVRELSEWEQFHIPGSTLIPLGQLSSRVGEVPRDRDVVVVCRTGNRSKKGRDILVKAGFPRVTNMKGGVTDWKAEGLPVVSGR
jgi:rhodanese-related sulfurtransferase